MAGDYNIIINHKDRAEITNIAFDTSAQYAYDLYREKKRKIDELQYECDLLIDKYHAEMQKSHIPFEFCETHLLSMFEKNQKKTEITQSSRDIFLKKAFSKNFLENHIISFISYESHGYTRSAIGIVLGIGDYQYTIQFPLPQNIFKDDDKKMLMGEVKFRVDRIHISHKNDFVKTMESVQMPTYDWKKCFDAIESIVDSDNHSS